MQRYIYTARDETGRAIKGIMMAEDDTALATKISQLGYFLTSFKVSKEAAGEAKQLKMPHMNSRELLQFTFQIATLIDAGLPLLESLKDLARESDDPKLQRVVDDIRYRVESGSSLKESLAFHPKSFPKLYISIIGAGETTGKLPSALNDLAAMLEWQLDLVAKIKEAATYPLILAVVLISVVILLVTKIIPMFKPLFSGLGAELPAPTRAILGLSDFITNYWLWLLIGIGVIVASVKFYNTTSKGRFVIDGIKLKLPILGPLMRKIVLSRFTHTLSLAVKSGVHLLVALDIAKETCGNFRVEKAIARVRDSVNVGEKLAGSMQVSGEFPPLVIRMISVGEQSGALTHTLAKVSEFYDKEVTATIKRIFALFEPIMIVIMGIVVGGIALSIFLPVFSVSQMLGD